MQNRSNYPPEWFDTIRPTILKRDHYQCTNCKVKHRAVGYYDQKGLFVECDKFMRDWALYHGFKIVTIYIQVAHLDQNPSNNDLNNLKSMCPRCHMNYDRPFNIIKRKSR